MERFTEERTRFIKKQLEYNNQNLLLLQGRERFLKMALGQVQQEMERINDRRDELYDQLDELQNPEQVAFERQVYYQSLRAKMKADGDY